jgi:nucleoside-diphosphate-sugar epimerase
MADSVVLVTGAGGELGRLLVPAIRKRGHEIVALDLKPLPDDIAACCRESVTASVLELKRVEELLERHRPAQVFHLAAVLSTKAEREPALAHTVNVDGTVHLMNLCADLGTRAPVRFLFPSSIAIYGLPDPATKLAAGAVRESEWTFPAGIYGCNKLYCELLGSHYARNNRLERRLDFRSIRFPGLISADSVPSGGTSDYAPEMIHAAAQGRPYACFVREDTRLPFMTMTDAVEAFLLLASAPENELSRRVYNIRAFSPSAGELRDRLRVAFPHARVTFEPDDRRQAIVDSWPADVDDQPAREDWGLAPRHGLSEALDDYLLPALRARYSASAKRQAVEP